MLRLFNVGDTRSTVTNDLQKLKQTVLSSPFSPVKRHILTAIFDYFIHLAQGRSVFRLILTDIDPRIKAATMLFENATKLSDDNFIVSTREFILNNFAESSELRSGTLLALNTAEKELAERRIKAQKYIAGIILLTYFASPSTGMFIIALAVGAYLTDYYKSACNEALELYDSTGYVPKEAEGPNNHERELRTTYHRWPR